MWVLRGALAIDGTGSEPIPDSEIAIDQGEIVGLAPGGIAIPRSSVADAVDISGLTVVPGLIDSHVHLCFNAGNDPYSDFMSADASALLQTAKDQAEGALRSGVTVVRDCGSPGSLLARLRDEIRDGAVTGPRILVSGTPITSPGGHLHFLGEGIRGASAVRQAVEDRLASGADFIKLVASGGAMTPGSDMRLPQFSAEEMSAVVQAAHARGAHVAAHAHSTESIRRAVRAAVDTIEHCSWVGYEGEIDFDADAVEQMVHKRTIVSPAANVRFRSTPEELYDDPGRREDFRRFQRIRFDTTRRMVAAGLRLIVGTDAGVAHTPCSDYSEVFGIFVERFGLLPMDALMAATSWPAEAMGIGNELGSIAVGKRADLVVLDGNPLVDLTAYRRVRLVVREGRVVVRDGALVHSASGVPVLKSSRPH